MDEISSHIKMHKAESTTKDGTKYLLEVANRQYFVGELIYFIIHQLQSKKTLKEISDNVNFKYKPEPFLTDCDIKEIVKKNIRPLGVFENSIIESKVNTSIKAKITLFSVNAINLICNPIKFLFSPLFFFINALILLAINLYFIFWANSPLIKFDISSGGVGYYLLMYPGLIILTLIHEFGHSAATLKFKVQPKSIGFGFYYLLPVLYTDISGIWRLSKKKRTIINLAGIYMQLLSNSIILLISLLIENVTITSFLYYLALVNTSIIIINLLPFIKYDAYWLYSDLSGINNLQSKSVELLKKLFLNLFRKVNGEIKNTKPSLIIFSICRGTFFILVYYLILKAFYVEMTSISIVLEIFKYFHLSTMTILFTIRVLFIYVFGLVVSYSIIRMIWSFSLNYRK